MTHALIRIIAISTLFFGINTSVLSEVSVIDNELDTQSIHYPAYSLIDLSEDTNGYLENNGSDSYLIINDLDLTRANACNLSLTLSFKNPLERPAMFELFWATNDSGFTEGQKGWFIINQADSVTQNQFVVPLCKLYHFSGNLNRPDYQRNIQRFRLDYPGNKTVSVRFKSIDFYSNAELRQSLSDKDNKKVITLEPYERVAGRSFTSFDSIVPKLTFALEHGLSRLTLDMSFLIFWLLLIAGLLALILRSYRH